MGCTPNDDIVHCGVSLKDLKNQAIKYVLAQASCDSIACIMNNEYVDYNHGGGQKGTQQSMTEQACWKEYYGGLKDFLDKKQILFFEYISKCSKTKKINSIKLLENKKVGMKQREIGVKMLKESNADKRHAVLFMLEEINKFHSIVC